MYIVMEYCQGKTLWDRLEIKGTFTERETAQLIYKIIEGLNHVHASDVVHRDIKPENIIVDDHGDPKIIDFGLSKDTKENTRILKSFVGSKIYMAPEILGGSVYSETCDMWSIGIICWVMLTADYPFSSRNLDHDIINAPIFFQRQAWQGVGDSCKDLILKLLDRDDLARIKSSGAINHPWFNEVLKDDKDFLAEHNMFPCNDGSH